MCSAGICNIDDLFAYSMNLVLYDYLMDALGVTYAGSEFTKLELDELKDLS